MTPWIFLLVIGLVLIGTHLEAIGIVLASLALGMAFAHAAMPDRPFRGDRDSWRD